MQNKELNVSNTNTKLWSTIGSRATYGLVAFELAKSIDDFCAVTADTSTSAGLDRLKKMFPAKYVDVGIAEQNMMGIAAGMASEGYTVFTSTFAPFQTMRCCEQIRMNLGYMQHKVTMVGLASGMVLRQLGPSHCCLEDLAILRAISGITILSPADAIETAQAVWAAAFHPQPVYIRLTGDAKSPSVTSGNDEFVIGRAKPMRAGSTAMIFATGQAVFASLQAAEVLAKKGLSVGVTNVHTIAPIDCAMIEEACRSVELIVTVEEHSICGGLGTAVAEVKSRMRGAPAQLFLGYDHAIDKVTANTAVHLSADAIASKIFQALLLP